LIKRICYITKLTFAEIVVDVKYVQLSLQHLVVTTAN